jgi:DNA-binding Lrp family transcriptional regulator
MAFKLTALDRKILSTLMQDSRISTAKLARVTRTSREVANYRIARLEKAGIILGYVTEINIERLGFLGGFLLLAIKKKAEARLKEYISASKNICWVGEHIGRWDIGMSILGKTPSGIDAEFNLLYRRFRDNIIDHQFVMHKKNYYFNEKLFGQVRVRKEKPERDFKLDNNDKKILKLLSRNARIGYVELAGKIPLTAQAIKSRIRRLESSGIIDRYTIFIGYTKLGIYQYSVFIANKSIEDRPGLISFLEQHRHVCYICEYIGDQFLEFGVFLEDPYRLRDVLREIEERFPDNRVVEISLQKEIISTAPADCVFEPCKTI